MMNPSDRKSYSGVIMPPCIHSEPGGRSFASESIRFDKAVYFVFALPSVQMSCRVHVRLKSQGDKEGKFRRVITQVDKGGHDGFRIDN